MTISIDDTNLRLSYTDDNGTTHIISLGQIVDISDSYTKSVSSYPLLSMSQDDCFAIETGSALTYTLNFKHIDGNPEVYVEVTKNGQETQTVEKIINDSADWYNRLTSFVDRWQSRTNGFKLFYRPAPRDSDGYNPAFYPVENVNGFVRSLSRQYSESCNTVYQCSMTFEVGTMHIGIEPLRPIDDTDFDKDLYELSNKKAEWQILMSDSSGTMWYPLLYPGNDDTCITDYVLKGGPSDPFEHLDIVLSKKKLMSQYPTLAGDIEYGRNRLILRAVGRSNMTVYDGMISNLSGTWTLKAYGDSERIRGGAIDMDGQYLPYAWIKEILCTGKYGVQYAEDKTLLCDFEDRTGPEDYLSFAKGTNTWAILQICATYLRAKIWFANNCAYVVDYTKAGDTTKNLIRDYATIDLHATDPHDEMYGRTTGNVSTGHEGANTICNFINVRCTDGEGNSTTVTYSDEESMNVYDIKEDTEYVSSLIEGPYTIPVSEETVNYEQGSVFARNSVIYRREPQESVTFTTKELRNWDLPTGDEEGTVDSGLWWSPTFLPCARLEGILDDPNEIAVDNVSFLTGERAPQLLYLSQFECRYPNGTTTYTFGQIESITLSDSTSKITTALSGI